jgi:hypothetical protein
MDHVCLLHNLSNGVALSQEIVTSSILPIITKILTIENDKLYNTFLHVAFGSQNLLKSTGDQTGSDPIEELEKAARGAVNRSQSKFLA